MKKKIIALLSFAIIICVTFCGYFYVKTTSSQLIADFSKLNGEKTDLTQFYSDENAQISVNMKNSIPVLLSNLVGDNEIGNPSKTISLIEKFELNQVVSNNMKNENVNAFSADSNSPNGNWWVFRWYQQMKGKKVSVRDKSDFNGIITLDENNSQIEIICNNKDNGEIILTNLDKSSFHLFENVKIHMEYTDFTGVKSVFSQPVFLKEYEGQIKKSKIKIKLPETNDTSAFHIVIQPVGTEIIEDTVNDNLPVRYEAENAKSDFNAIKSNYVSSNNKVVKLDKNIEFAVNIKENGSYKLDVVYKSKYDDSFAVYVDDVKINEIKPKSTDYLTSLSFISELEKGKHQVKIVGNNDFEIDFVEVTFLCGQYDALPNTVYNGSIDSRLTNETSTAFLVSVDENEVYDTTFYFTVNLGETVDYTVNGEKKQLELSTKGMSQQKLELKKGLNYIVVNHNSENAIDEFFAVKIID